MAGRRVHIVMDAELVERIDAIARERGMSRGEWLRLVAEGALQKEATPLPPVEPPVHEFVPPSTHEALVEAARADEQPSKPLPHYNEGDTLPVAKSQTFPADAFRRSSSQAKRDVRPVPKKG